MSKKNKDTDLPGVHSLQEMLAALNGKQPSIALNQKRNLRMPEFSQLYGIGRTKTYQEIKAGRLKAFKCGATTLIPVESAEAWQKHYCK